MCQLLTDLCLETIGDNFDRFNFVFRATEDENMKRKFEFLQRKYSSNLLSQLSMRDELPEEYIDLLINKYLKVLDTNWFRKCSWDKVTSKIAEIGSNVEKMFFQDWYFEELSGKAPWQDIICYLPNLKSFISNDDFDDLILKNIVIFCHNIEEIDVRKFFVSDEALKGLFSDKDERKFCLKLKKFYIAPRSYTDNVVKYLLKNLPSLEIINYLYLPLVLYSLHKNDLSSLDKVSSYNIVELDLLEFTCESFFADVKKICLSLCPCLKSLTCSLESEDDFNLFSNLSELEHLHIESSSNSEVNINNLLKSNGRKLTSLTIVDCVVSVSLLAENCPCLKELTMSTVHYLFGRNDTKPEFMPLSSITFLNCSDPSGARGMSLLLAASKKLESVSFIRCNLSSSMKALILKCCVLYPIKKITVSWSKTEKEFVKELLLKSSTLSNLNLLDCVTNNIDDLLILGSDIQELMRLSETLPNKPEVETFDSVLTGPFF